MARIPMAQCMVCRDIKKYDTTVYEIRNMRIRIHNALLAFNSEFNSAEAMKWMRQKGPYLNLIKTDHQNVRFMCGACPNANTMEITREESSLRQELMKACYLFSIKERSEVINVYHNITQSLRGYYPITLREIERIQRVRV